MTTIATLSPLGSSEQRKLAQYEETIERGVRMFFEVGSALMAIQENRLYRSEFDSFDSYCKKRWGYAKSYTYRLIESAKVIKTCSQIGDIDPPENEAQARELASVDTPEKQADVWAKAVSTAKLGTDGKPRVTAAHVRKVANQLAGKDPEPEEDPDDPTDISEPERKPAEPPPIFAHLASLPDDMAEAFEEFKLSILRHKISGWTEISRPDAIDALDKLKQLALSPSE